MHSRCEAAEERPRLAALLASVLGIDRVVAVRRADVELQPARHQDVADLGQPLAQLLALAGRVAGIRHLDVVADHDVRARAGDVGGDAAGEERRVALGQRPVHGELIRGPLIHPGRHQVPGQRVTLDDPPDVAHHLAREVMLGGEHQDAQVGVVRQQPGAKDPDQRRLAGAAEHQHHQAAITVPPAPAEPFRDLQMEGRRASVPGTGSTTRRTGESRPPGRARRPPSEPFRVATAAQRGCADHIDGDGVRRPGPAVLDIDLAVGVRGVGELAGAAGGAGKRSAAGSTATSFGDVVTPFASSSV